MVARLRFAPSPTGPVHVGNVHTAVFCWALSRALKGDFIMRIEDTDTERNTAEATRLLFDALTWIGLDWDEGPDVGGEFGPYVQSQRRPLHQRVIEQLADEGHAYYGDDPAHPASPAGTPLRLKMQIGETVLHDAIRGGIWFDNGRLQDPVIVRSSGEPLYHLAAMTDDHDMGITHVVRGEDFISTAPIHLQLYRAMGWAEPVWVHLPLILNRQGQKLKKRDPEGLGWSLARRRRTGIALALMLLVPGIAAVWTAGGKLFGTEAIVPSTVPLTLAGLGALAVNALAAYLLARVRKHGGSLTLAAFLSARNDVIANVAIIAAGLATAWLQRILPDLVVGVGVAVMNAGAAWEVYEAAVDPDAEEARA